MDQKYQRVEMGVGAFHHPPRAKYSEETKNLIKRKQIHGKLNQTVFKFLTGNNFCISFFLYLYRIRNTIVLQQTGTH